MKKDELDENSSVEIIEERMQRIHTSRMDTRLRTPAPRRKRVGGWEKERQLRKGKQHRLEEVRVERARIRGLKHLTRDAPDERTNNATNEKLTTRS